MMKKKSKKKQDADQMSEDDGICPIFQYWGKCLVDYQKEDFIDISSGYGRIKHISIGDNHIFLGTSEKFFFSFGDNSHDQLGQENIKYVNFPMIFNLPEKIQIE